MFEPSQPQTPRIDIPSGNSSNVPPDSPSSSLSSPSSASWISRTSETQAQLTLLLKDAYNTIREREKDLIFSAEIGKSLLENNIALKQKYDSAIVQLQQLQRERKKAASLAFPPDDSLNFDDESDNESNESHRGRSTSIDSTSSTDLFSQLNDNSSKRKKLENLKELETRNQKLQQQLDKVMREYDNLDGSNKAKIRKLEADLIHFQDTCASATQKIKDLEKENDDLKQRQKADFWNLNQDCLV